MELREVFAERNYLRCLNAYGAFAEQAKWPVAEHLALYNHAKAAFDETVVAHDKVGEFGLVYGALRGSWGLGRGAKEPMWSAPEVYRVLQLSGAAFGRTSTIGLSDMSACSRDSELMDFLDSLGGMKKMREFPHMAVSKVMHFFNPRIFPIYDTAVIWTTVMQGTLKSDYARFCSKHYPRYKVWEPESIFNAYYMEWASQGMNGGADHDFMEVFSRWFATRASGVPDPHGVLQDLNTYYSVAFEYAVIGATRL